MLCVIFILQSEFLNVYSLFQQHAIHSVLCLNTVSEMFLLTELQKKRFLFPNELLNLLETTKTTPMWELLYSSTTRMYSLMHEAYLYIKDQLNATLS